MLLIVFPNFELKCYHIRAKVNSWLKCIKNLEGRKTVSGLVQEHVCETNLGFTVHRTTLRYSESLIQLTTKMGVIVN